MRLRHLAVRHFRNLTSLDLEVPPDGAVVVGRNGHGKTNLLEAIYYLVLFRSFRGAQDRDAVEFGSAGFFVSGEIDDVTDEIPRRAVTAGFDAQVGFKKITVDGEHMPRFSDAIGQLRAVVITPDDRELVAGSPGLRRRYLDIVLSLTCAGYMYALRRYRRALRQRNAALRRLRPDEAAAFEPTLNETGREITDRRQRWVDLAAKTFCELTRSMGEEEEVGLEYHTGDGELDYAAAREHDLSRGTTTIGPHRDDLAITLDRRRMSIVGSAGQQRTAATALRLLEAESLGNPMLLLDDIFAELDDERRERLATLLSGRQRILAAPREACVPDAAHDLARWRVDQGAIST